MQTVLCARLFAVAMSALASMIERCPVALHKSSAGHLAIVSCSDMLHAYTTDKVIMPI